MMRKRKAESSSLQEPPPPPPPPPQKKYVCDAERVLEAVDALHAAASPALFTTLVGERRRKRPRCCEDHEEHGRTEAPGGDMSNDADGVMQGTEDECVSGKVRSLSDARTCVTASEESASDARTCVMASEESASDARTCVMASEESVSGSKVDACTKATLPDDNEDGPCEFNSFQFWRTPLPALDLSLLDAPSITELSEDSSLKDSTEDMET
ncbi:hypothetical protein QTP70_018665 [Hemibagrus guttatus]|uniref:Putative WW-binding domain-containing protein n=1 Tax=Hemibagrus guttatus TaxID=175788 RepID=A0AAE0Q653_9TELE|nr:hypothetical protein QTP70_018665 [Hemibagrus guttatus]